MKILIADQDARLLAAITATFGRHCDVVTVSSREACLAELGKHEFDVIVAGDKLVTYTGLELLSEVAAASPATLRIFLARPARLEELAPRLEFFGLFGTLTYPLDPRKLLAELRRARESLKNSTASRKIRHVVLQDDWDTGERLGLAERALPGGEPLPEPPVLASATQDASAPVSAAPVAPPTSAAPAMPTTNAAPAIPPTNPAPVAPPTSGAPAMPTKGTIEIGYGLPELPATAPPTKSLSELARLATKKQPLPDFRRKRDSARRSKALLLTGSGIAVAALATVLTLKAMGRTDPVAQQAAQPTRATSTRLFSSGATVVTNGAGIPTLSAPPAPAH
ncbi:MAG TPA: hypothetical protein VHB68_12670 [Steroidobacteraceae bacterium]|nr:hypothetical protein [Steroidobacteraceae bacterium]